MNLKHIYYDSSKNSWKVSIKTKHNLKHIGLAATLREAMAMRDSYYKHSLEDDGGINRLKMKEPPKSTQDLIDTYGLKKVLDTPLDELMSEKTTISSGIKIGGSPIEDGPPPEKPPEKLQSRDPIGYTGKPPHTIVIFGDLHVPYHHPDTIAFLEEVTKLYNPDIFLNVGDEVDSQSLSFYPQHPDLANATAELKLARMALQEIDQRVIKGKPVYSVESNHTSRMYRKAKASGIPRDLLLSYEQALGVNWNWYKDLVIPLPNGTDLFVTHHKGTNTLAAGQSIGSNIVAGHYHKRGGIMYWTNAHKQLFFAMSNPCLIDFDSPAYSYDENTMIRPNLGCSVVVNSVPLVVPMEVDKNNRWTKRILGLQRFRR